MFYEQRFPSDRNFHFHCFLCTGRMHHIISHLKQTNVSIKKPNKQKSQTKNPNLKVSNISLLKGFILGCSEILRGFGDDLFDRIASTH